MDSADPNVLEYYESKGVAVHKSSDQYSTDLMKCMKQAQDQWFLAPFEQLLKSGTSYDGRAAFKVVAIGALGGRVDQSFHSIQNLYMTDDLCKAAVQAIEDNVPNFWEKSEKDENGNVDLYAINRATLPHEMILLSVEDLSANLTFLIPSHATNSKDSQISCVIDTPRAFVGPAVGLLPVQGLTHITTHGLQWDIENWATEFGGQLSTSNYLQSDVVEVATKERPIVFTVEIKLK